MTDHQVTILVGILAPTVSAATLIGTIFGLNYNAKKNLESLRLTFNHADEAAQREREHQDAVAKADRLRPKGEELFLLTAEWCVSVQALIPAFFQNSNLNRYFELQQESRNKWLKIELLVHLYFPD